MKALTKITFNLLKAFLAFNVIAKNEHIILFFAFLIKFFKNMII